MRVNKYGSHGKENFFQGKNVQTNKGKAKMVEQPMPTIYKEAYKSIILSQMIRFFMLMKMIAYVSGVVA